MSNQKTENTFRQYIHGLSNNSVVQSTVMSLLKTKLIYTIDVSNCRTFEYQVLSKYFKNLPVMHCYQTKGSCVMKYLSETTQTVDVCIYKGCPIVFEIRPDVDNRRVQIYFHTLQDERCKIILNRFCAMLMKCSNRYRSSVPGNRLSIYEAPRMQFIKDITPRSFDNVFIENCVMEKLHDTIRCFYNKRDWYVEKSIPYHLGILLYGPPGTGKSTLIQPIAKLLNAKFIHIYDTDRLVEFPEYIRHNSDEIEYRCAEGNPTVIAIEDIDCSKLTTSRDTTSVSYGAGTKINSVSLASILNYIDGLNAPDGAVYIFTTNNIDMLDPALIRPGRIDLKLNIGYLTNETLDKFIMFHYDRHLPEGFNICDGLTCAKLQIDVLRGCTYEEMIELCSKRRMIL